MVAIFTGSGTGFERGSGNVLGSSGLLGSSGFGRSGSQVFLNAANGNLLINRQDEFLVGRGPDAGVARTYNSLGDMSDDNGDNWRQSTQRAVRLNGAANSWGSSVTHRMGDGSEVAYYWNGSAYTIAGGAGIHDKVVIDGAVLRWTDGDSGIVETYENDGVTEWRRLKTVADTSGNAVTYGYTGDKLTSITTADGGTIQYSWAGSHITQVNSGDGTLTRYFYDSYDRLSQVDIELTSGGGVYSTIYTYHGSSKLVATISETDGASVSIGYDSDNRVTSLVQTVSSGVTRTTSLVYGEGYTSVTDPAGQVTTLWYDWTGALVQITAPPAYAGAAQQTVTFGYNEDGDLSSVTDSAGYTATYVRDSWGRVVAQVDRLDNILLRTFNATHKTLTETRPSSGTTRYVYDSADRLRFMISGEGNVVEYVYNGYGQKIYDIAYADQSYDLTGLSPETELTEAQLASWKASLADPSAALHTEYVHDIYGNVTYVYKYGAAYSPGNPHVGEAYSYRVMSYDRAGRMLTSAVAGENMATYAYDGLGRVVASTDVKGGTTSFVFNDAQTQTVVTLANGLVQTSVYNKMGELVSLTESGSFVASGQGTATVASSYKYDKLGRLRVATDPSGIASYYLYDKAGRKVADINAYGVIEYRYDTNNRLVATARYASGINGGSATLTQLADPDNSLDMAAIRPGPSGQDLWSWTVYDREGRALEAIEGDGSVTTYEYDALGRPVRTTGYVNKLTASQVASFRVAPPASVVLPTAHVRDSVARIFYDKDGRTIGALDGEGYLVRTIYDRAGRKVQEIAYANATNAADRANGTFQNLIDSAGTSAADRSMRYVYDGQGLLRFTVDAVSHVTEYRYGSGSDAFGLVRQTVQYAGALGALSSYGYASVKSAVAALAGNSANRTSWTVYNVAGSIAYAIDAAGAVTGYSYDDRGQVTKQVAYATLRVTTTLPTQSDMNSWAGSAVSNNDRITRFYYSARGELRFTVDAEGYVNRTDYDGAGRLLGTYRWDNPVSVGDGWTIAMVSGAVSGGNSGTTSYYDAAGRLSYTLDDLGVMHAYWIGANNLLTLEIEAYGTADERRTQFAYDAAGRLTSRQDAAGTVEQATTLFEYNGLGDLVSTTDAKSHTTSWTYDKLGRKVGETNAAGGVTSFEYNAFGDLVRAIDARGNSTWSYYDKLGRVVTTRDAEDYVTETAYTVFGEVDSVTRRYERATNTASVASLPAIGANEKDATTSFAYDKLGRVITTTDAEGGIERTWYNAAGDVIQMQNKLGGMTIYKRDRRGLVTRESVDMAVYDPTGTQTASAYCNIYEYDARGNVKHQVEAYDLPERRDTYFAYDRAGRLTSKTSALVSYVDQSNHIGLIWTTPVESYKYDKRGNLVETTDANGARTLFWYDALDRKVAELGALGTLSTYGYDPDGNLIWSRTYATTIALPGTPAGTPPAAPGGEYRETSYAYDAIDRLTSTSVTGVRTGTWNGSSFALSTAAITTSYAYDAAGNVVSTTDANGVTSYAYYDKLGRKTLAVDALGYATRWKYDAEGNALTERRYALQFSGASVVTPPAVAENASDRVTAFTYDRMGRRTAEHRYDVEAHAVNASTGVLSGNSGIASIYYSYNMLGQVTRKTEATGEYSDYEYDLAGRLMREQRATITDYTGTAVRPVVSYYYDALGNLVRSVQAGGTAPDRVTRYIYSAGGRLFSKTDPSGSTIEYYYDAAGNILRENYTRAKSDGSTTYEGILYSRDIAGRVTAQTVAAWNGSAWVKGDIQNIAYNAYGEVAQKGLNGGWQEQFAYDGAGRLYRSNSGDGVWRYYVHDANGNQSAIIESEGNAIAGLTLDQALSSATAGFAYGLGQLYVDGLNITINAYDKRGQATSTRLAQRQLSAAGGTTDIVTSRSYNAFGEVATETDARGNQTNYGYNAMGRTLYVQRASVLVTYENGSQASVNPSAHNYYDIAGRLIAQDDANGNRTTRTLLAGTGYGGSEAQMVWEWHPDGGIVKNGYDRFGDLRRVTEVNRTTAMDYDAMGRLTQVTRPSGAAEYYAYDVLGQRIRHWNGLYGTTNVETTDYDVQGRVVRTVAYGGDPTTTSYSWLGGIATSGMGTFGGWVETTTYANGLSATEHTDMFGHVTWKSDLGGHITSTTYDLAGRMTGRTTSGAQGTETASYAWLNNGQVGTVTTTAAGTTTTQISSYDKSGNKLTEYTTRGGLVIQDATSTYDALNRLLTWSEAGNTTLPAASMTYSYDANSNVRRMQSSFRYLDQAGAAYNSAATQDYWYRYDSLNRMTTSQGALSNGAIAGGTQVTYDAAGQRISVATMSSGLVWSGWKAVIKGSNGQIAMYADEPGSFEDDGYIWSPSGPVNYSGKVVESYGYDADGRLATVSVAGEGGTADNSWPTGNGVMGSAVLRASFGYDALGRLASQVDYAQDGTAVVHSRSDIVYDAAGRVASETIVARQAAAAGASFTTTTTYTTYGYGVVGTAGYALGAVVTIDADTWQNGSDAAVPDTRTTYGYDWFDGAVQSSIQYRPDMNNATAYNTSFGLTPTGQVGSATIADGRQRSVAFTLDAYGQAVRRDETDNNTSLGDPHQLWYRFNGRELGTVGNDTLEDGDYASSIAARQVKQGTGPFRNGQDYGGGFARFGEAYVPYTSYAQGSGGGSYTADGGETLSQLAAQLWGDAGLWYLLAEANGISSDISLIQGQAITLPQGVTRNSNTAATFKPFDPAEALGNLNPTTPRPQKKAKNCGTFGAIIIAVVAVAAALATSGAIIAAASNVSFASGLSTLLGTSVLGGAVGTAGTGLMIGAGAAGGMVASAASQGVAIATGMQSQFDWKAVAMGGVSGAIGGALGGGGLFKDGAFSGIGSKVGGLALRGLSANALGQGVGVATGLQSKFDFAGVAAAGMGALAGASIGGAGLAGRINSIGADALASAATRSVMTGTDFGDNLLAVLPDVVARTIGAAFESAVATDIHTQQARTLSKAVQGERPSTPQQKAAVREYATALAALDENPTSRSAQQRVDTAIRSLLDAAATTDAGRIRVADFYAIAHGEAREAMPLGMAGEIVVSGSDRGLNWATTPLIDRAGRGIGIIKQEVEGRVDALLEQHPGAAIALNVANTALTIGGGPVRAGLGYALEAGKKRVEGWVSDRYVAAGWDPSQGALGGSGVVWAGLILLSGAGALRSAGRTGESGSYTNLFESGKTYAGKGSRGRSQRSARDIEAETGDRHIATDWSPARSQREAFKDESRRLDAAGGARSSNTHNKINSPGTRYRRDDGEIP